MDGGDVQLQLFPLVRADVPALKGLEGRGGVNALRVNDDQIASQTLQRDSEEETETKRETKRETKETKNNMNDRAVVIGSLCCESLSLTCLSGLPIR